MPPLWVFGLFFVLWLALCAGAAWPVVRRMGPRTRAALILPTIAGIVAVFVASGWLKVRLDFGTGLVLSLVASAVAAALQALAVRRRPSFRGRRLAAVPVGRRVHDPRDVGRRRWDPDEDDR